MKKASLLITVFFVLTVTLKGQKTKIEIRTAIGTIVAELYPDKAPITCENFLAYIKNDMLRGASFYRVVRMDNQPDKKVKIEVIQGGLNNDSLAFTPITHETTAKTGLLHKDGVLSMARNEPGTATTEFFICIGDQPELDFGGKRNPDGQGFAAFGQIVKGMDIVKQIQGLEDDDQMLIEPIKIKAFRVLE